MLIAYPLLLAILALFAGAEYAWIKAGILLVISYVIVYGVHIYNPLSQFSTLPATIFLLISASIIHSAFDIRIFVALFLFSLAFMNMQRAIYVHTNANIFNFGFFMLLAVICFPKLLPLLVWSLLVLFITGRSAFRDILALLLGFISVGIFVYFFEYWYGYNNSIFYTFIGQLYANNKILTPHYTFWIAAGLFALVLIFASGAISRYYTLSVINQRRSISMLLSLLLFLLISIFVVPGIESEYIYFIALPISYYFARYFLIQKTKYKADILFVLLIIGSALLYI
jgi:hypothetical protein